jgi:hypothetical protein
MAQIRSLSDLQDAMAVEFAWRKKELHGLKTMVMANEATHGRDLCIRAAITLLYAHWEGIVKQLGDCYLEFVARRKLRYDQLRDNFLAMVLRTKMHRASSAGMMERCLDVVSFFRSQSAERSNIKWKSGTETKSNLNAAVFREIVLSLGLDYSRFATKEKLLDEKLLGHRNRIAHGQYLLIGFQEYLDLHDEVIGMMQELYNQIDNAAFTGAYRI